MKWLEKRRRKHEEDISALKPKESQRPWLPETDVH
jgi:hypothetical protein